MEIFWIKISIVTPNQHTIFQYYYTRIVPSMQNQEKPLISIIVPVYNVAPYLPNCLDSIINQTYKNLEIILVASTSPDNSVEICDEYAEKNKRISVIHCPANGLSDGRNRGIDAAHGEYLSFIDSDDFIAPEFIQALYDIIVEYECDIAQGGFLRVPETQNTIPDSVKSDSEYSISTYTNKEMLMKMNSYGTYIVMTWNKLYHRSLFSEIRFPVGKLYEDVATSYKLFYSAKKIGSFLKPMYFYRQVPTSIMGQPYSSKRLDALEHARDAVTFFKELEEYDIYGVAICNLIFSLNSTIIQVREHIADSEEIQTALQEEMRERFGELRGHRTARILYKCAAFMMVYIPRVVNGMLAVRRRILARRDAS